MKIRKTTIVYFDLKAILKRVRKQKNYTRGERQRLEKFYALFEQGKFKECILYATTFPDTKHDYNEREHINCEIFQFLLEYDMWTEDSKYELLSNE